MSCDVKLSPSRFFFVAVLYTLELVRDAAFGSSMCVYLRNPDRKSLAIMLYTPLDMR